MTAGISMTTKSRKVTVSVRADLVNLVDTYVEDHKKENLNRSAIVEEALLLWKQQMQEHEDELYFKRNANKLNADARSWMPIATEAAKLIWE
jgi:Arc/MetJ-type ribon-helix-helix transcriptional regulator